MDTSETKCFYIFIIHLYNIFMFIIVCKKTHVEMSNKNGLDFLNMNMLNVNIYI